MVVNSGEVCMSRAAALEPGARGRVPEIVPRRLLEGVLSLGLSRTSA
jgi:hypothetical protein